MYVIMMKNITLTDEFMIEKTEIFYKHGFILINFSATKFPYVSNYSYKYENLNTYFAIRKVYKAFELT